MPSSRLVWVSFLVVLVVFVTSLGVVTAARDSDRQQVAAESSQLEPAVDPGAHGLETPPEKQGSPSSQSSGLFEPYVTYAKGDDPHAVAIGDLNNDQLNDVAMTTGAQLFVFLQSGSRTLDDPVAYPVGGKPRALAVGDLNDDGLDDLVVGNSSDDTILILVQQPDGTLQETITLSTADGPDAVAVGDFSGDGRDDIAVSHWRAGEVKVFVQQADGAFSAVSYAAPQAGYDDIDAGDLNGDGLTDVVKMNGQGLNPNLSVYLQNGDGSLEGPFSYDLDDGNPNGGAVGDVTGDGLDDVVVTHGGNRPQAKLAIWAQTAGGTLELHTVRYAYDCPEPVEIADVNLDGLGDVLIAHGGWEAVSVYLQRPDGTLGSYGKYSIPYASHYEPQGLDVGDINDDGLPDVVLADSGHGLVVLYHRLTPPDFELFVSPVSLAVQQGDVASWTVEAVTSYGFSEPISLGIDGLPPEITCDLSANPLHPPYDPVTLTVQTSSTTPPGSYPLSVVGASQDLTHTAWTHMVVIGPDFHLEVSPVSNVGERGESVYWTVDATPLEGFSAPISLSVQGLPPEATSDFSVNPAYPPYDPVTFSMHLSPTTPEDVYLLSILGTSQNLVRTAWTELIVPERGFYLYVIPEHQEALPGATVTWDVEVYPYGDFSEPISLTLEGLPQGASYDFSVNPVPLPYYPVTLSVQLGSMTPPGSYPLSVVGVSQETTRTAWAELVVPQPDFQLNVSPSSNEALPGDTISWTVEAEPAYGFSEPISLSVEGLPSGASYEISANPISPPHDPVTLTVHVRATTPAGVYSLSVVGAGQDLTRVAWTELIVRESDFEISVSPLFRDAPPGAVVSWTVEAVPLYGFSKPITLSVEGLPPGAGYELSANPILPPYDPVTLSVQLSAATPEGTYQLSLVGTSQDLTRFASTELLVAPPDFTLSVSPSSRTVQQGKSTSWTVSVARLRGFSEPISLTLRGLPPGATYSFSDNPAIHPDGAVTLRVQLGLEVPRGTHQLTVVGTSTGLVRTAGTQLVVFASHFQPYVTYAKGGWPHAVGIGDLNSDGLNDVAMSTGNQLYVFLQNFSGRLSDPRAYSTGYWPESLAVGDLNNDGRDDVVVTNTGHRTIAVFLQRPDGTMADQTSYATASYPGPLAVGDVNGDGRSDVAVAVSNAGLNLFLQQPDGTLARVSYPAPQAGDDDIDLGDLNGDGLTDVVKVNAQGLQNPNLSVYLQKRDGSLEGPVSYHRGGGLARGGAAGDVTGDGLDDVVVAHWGPLAVWGQTASGTLQLQTSLDAYPLPEPIEVADVNMDGLDDVLVANGGWMAVSVYLQRPDGTLASYQRYSIPYASHYKPQGMDVGDINDDGLPDVAIADHNNGLVVLYHTRTLPHFTLSLGPRSVIAVPGTASTWSISSTPFNGFSDPVSLSAEGLPAGATVSFSADALDPASAPATMTVQLASDTPSGRYWLSVVGSTVYQIYRVGTELIVRKPTFEIDVSPVSRDALPGGAASWTVEAVPEYGFSEPISLSVEGLPEAASYELSSNPISPPYERVTLTAYMGETTPPGVHPLSVVGAGGNLTRVAGTELIIPGFTLSADPPSITAQPGSQAAWAIVATPFGGFSDAIDVTMEGLPPGAVHSFSVNPVAPPSYETTLTLELGAAFPRGVYRFDLTGTAPHMTGSTTTWLAVGAEHYRFMPLMFGLR